MLCPSEFRNAFSAGCRRVVWCDAVACRARQNFVMHPVLVAILTCLALSVLGAVAAVDDIATNLQV